MAGNIKGITIEFNGDTTKLDKALREINQNTRSLDKELKSVNNALKFNPTNVDLWKQKQQLLTEKIGETKTKLDALKQAQAQMDAAGVDKNSQEYRELQREIITTESKLKTFNKQLREVGNANLKALSEQFKQIGSKAEAVGKKMTTYVTTPILGVGAASVKAFTEVKDGLNIVAQKTGATGDALEDMQTSARNLAKEIPTDFTTAGTAIGEVNTRFGVTGKTLEDLSKQYVKFAKVNGVDLNDSIDDTQKALAAFGLTAKDAPKLLDTLTKAGQKTGASVGDLTKGLIQNGAAFQELGLDITQSTLVMAQMEKSGANSETVMQGLRKALKNAAKEGKPLDQALSELQDTILNGTGSMDGLTAAYDLFGKSGDQIYAAVKNGTLDFKSLAAAAEDTGGTLDSVFEETLTPAEKFQTTLNSVKDAGYQLGSTIMTFLEPYMDKLAKKAQELSKWWEKLDPKTQNLIVKIALLAATIGPLLIVIGKVATGIGSIISLVNTVGSAIGILSSGSLLPIIAVIAAVVAAGVLLYKNWDKIKETAKNIASSVKEKWDNLKTSVSTAVDSVKKKVSDAWDSIKAKTSNAWESIKNFITSPFKTASDYVKKVVDWIKGFFPIDLKNLFNIKLPHFSWDWTEVGDTGIYLPDLNIDWWKKGAIFTKATLLGGGNGVGEAGPEAVLPLEKLWEEMDKRFSGGDEITINVYASDGMDVDDLALKIEQRLVQLQNQRKKAYGTI